MYSSEKVLSFVLHLWGRKWDEGGYLLLEFVMNETYFHGFFATKPPGSWKLKSVIKIVFDVICVVFMFVS